MPLPHVRFRVTVEFSNFTIFWVLGPILLSRGEVDPRGRFVRLTHWPFFRRRVQTLDHHVRSTQIISKLSLKPRLMTGILRIAFPNIVAYNLVRLGGLGNSKDQQFMTILALIRLQLIPYHNGPDYVV